MKSFLPFLLVGSFLLAGCVTGSATVTSSKDAAYTGTLERVLVVMHVTGDEAPLASSFEEHVVTALKPMGVAVRVERLAGLSLMEASPVDSLAKAFGTDMVMAFAQGAKKESKSQWVNTPPDPNTGMSTSFMMASNAGREFDVSLFEVDTKKRIWRAIVQTEWSGTASEKAGRKMGERVVAKLIEDGLIVPPPSAGTGAP